MNAYHWSILLIWKLLLHALKWNCRCYPCFLFSLFFFFFTIFFNDSREEQRFHKDKAKQSITDIRFGKIRYVFYNCSMLRNEGEKKSSFEEGWTKKERKGIRNLQERIIFYKLAVNTALHRIVYNPTTCTHAFLNRFCPRSCTVFALDNRHFMDEHGSLRFSTVSLRPTKNFTVERRGK